MSTDKHTFRYILSSTHMLSELPVVCDNPVTTRGQEEEEEER